jgi:hypothetical protein
VWFLNLKERKKGPGKVLKCVISEGGTEVSPGVIMERENVYRR